MRAVQQWDALGVIRTRDGQAKLDRAQLTRAEIGVDVAAGKLVDLRAAIDVAADNRAAKGVVAAGIGVRVGKDWCGEGGPAAVGPGEALTRRPSEIRTPSEPGGGRA